ncbi:hypothetical protein PMW_30 [Pseudomonas phage phiPMW]|uniref:Uncharacterized protein n=1 Tax=Pseudomonas phage phiPMW TaxID=1815582 RepID=A0A1S5R166_9CAUD|nr:hypothetical protein FDG97_gp030 [Pseudomonas phage phiPMW]ANA49155.1 hypothetical protein PMW_30 [Pseudomonas phage phiPMW]
MARKITTDAINAFMAGEKFNRDNTMVSVGPNTGACGLHLHGNLIATRERGLGEIEISNAGFFTNTTKERLNGIPGVSICQRKGVWYLNGNEWDGSWTKI